MTLPNAGDNPGLHPASKRSIVQTGYRIKISIGFFPEFQATAHRILITQ
jgi:hypothetical protein